MRFRGTSIGNIKQGKWNLKTVFKKKKKKGLKISTQRE